MICRIYLKASIIIFLLIYITFFTYTSALGQAPVLVSLKSNSSTIKKFSTLELNIDLTAAYTNPYDYDDIKVQGIFTGPNKSRDTVDGFFMQDYILDAVLGTITKSGSGSFKIRYTPTQTGNWSYVIECENKFGTAKINIGNNKFQLDLRPFTTGMYLLKVVETGEVIKVNIYNR